MFQQEIQNSFTIKITKNDKPKSLKSFALASKEPAIKISNFSPVFPKINDLIDDDIFKGEPSVGVRRLLTLCLQINDLQSKGQRFHLSSAVLLIIGPTEVAAFSRDWLHLRIIFLPIDIFARLDIDITTISMDPIESYFTRPSCKRR